MTHSVARMLVVLALGAAMMLAPAAWSPIGAVATASATGSVVRAQEPTQDDTRQPTSPPPDRPGDNLSQEQRYVIGGIGAAVILLVLALRRARGKAAFGVRWRKRG